MNLLKSLFVIIFWPLKSILASHLFEVRLSMLLSYLLLNKLEPHEPLPFASLALSCPSSPRWHKWTLTFVLGKIVLYSYLLAFLGRIALLNYLQRFSPDALADHWDLLFGDWARRFRFFNQHTTATYILLGPFSIYVDYAVYFLLDKHLLLLTYDLIIENRHDFDPVVVEVAKSSGSSNVFSSLFDTVKVLRQLGHLNSKSSKQMRLRRKHLAYFPYISVETRAKCLLPAALIECCFAASLMVVGKYKQ